jgi:hypothetical protein
MELTPSTHTQIDRRLQDIDRQISSALRDIRKNLEELEQASGRPGKGDSVAAGKSGDKSFAGALRKAMDHGDSAG